jgi:hypothetical protein
MIIDYLTTFFGHSKRRARKGKIGGIFCTSKNIYQTRKGVFPVIPELNLEFRMQNLEFRIV